jgi:hypothetical protein
MPFGAQPYKAEARRLQINETNGGIESKMGRSVNVDARMVRESWMGAG